MEDECTITKINSNLGYGRRDSQRNTKWIVEATHETETQRFRDLPSNAMCLGAQTTLPELWASEAVRTKHLRYFPLTSHCIT